MNKLSELSKPVAWASQRHIDTRHRISAFTDEESARGEGWQKVAPLYSQEYVSALLVELEAKDKRIAELERDKRQLNEIINTEANRADAAEKQLVYSRDAIATWERKAISNFEECAKMSQCIEELEKRLATPVRLSDSTHPRCRLQHADDIRTAGFKCVGDEQ